MDARTEAMLRNAGIRPESLPAGAKIDGRPIDAVNLTTARAFVSGRAQPTPGQMNKTEAKYAEQLDAWKAVGSVVAWWFEPFPIRLAARTYYRPDFLVQWATGVLQIVEVKGGYVRDDSAVKFKIAREKFPCFSWACLQRVKGGWKSLFD